MRYSSLLNPKHFITCISTHHQSLFTTANRSSPVIFLSKKIQKFPPIINSFPHNSHIALLSDFTLLSTEKSKNNITTGKSFSINKCRSHKQEYCSSLNLVATFDSSPRLQEYHNENNECVDDDELLHSAYKQSPTLSTTGRRQHSKSSQTTTPGISLFVFSLSKSIHPTSKIGSSNWLSQIRSFFTKRRARVAAFTRRIAHYQYSTTTTTTMAPIEFDYDLIVIGGGSGGLAASKEAASLGKKVCMLDFVTPTPRGVSWGVGGTCVNVGCIPKKLMHHASLIGSEIEDAHFFGWQQKDGQPLKDNIKHDWATLVQYVQNNIKGSNFSYRALLATQKVKYINAYGSFVDPYKLKIVHKNKKEEFLTAKNFIIATGERPVYPDDCEGAVEYSITSDDIFSLSYNPGKTLVVGASYVALECAGFLRGLGNDVSVMVRSIVLRGFDRQCSELVRSYMENVEHVKFIDKCVMKKIEEIKPSENGQPPLLRATYRHLETNEEFSDEFNTVLFAVGRKPCTDKIGLENAGVKLDEKGYIPTNNEQTNVPHIYAIGDIIQGKPQLTPVAIEAGILLARRLYSDHDVNCDYVNVPTTVFTPLEYGCCGLTEEEALAKYGPENIEVYHQYFTPTEWKLNYYDRPRKPMNVCYAKVITTRSKNKDPRDEVLLGFHFVGPNAGEVIQFTAFPLKMKATKADLDGLIGIHPTCAEIFTMLPISKRSGKEATQQGCCG